MDSTGLKIYGEGEWLDAKQGSRSRRRGASSTVFGINADRHEVVVAELTPDDVGDVSFAVVLLTLLGAAGEALGYDRMLKTNTVKRRVHSLFRAGCLLWHPANQSSIDVDWQGQRVAASTCMVACFGFRLRAAARPWTNGADCQGGTV